MNEAINISGLRVYWILFSSTLHRVQDTLINSFPPAFKDFCMVCLNRLASSPGAHLQSDQTTHSMVEIPLVSISLATICIESFLYGIFFTLFLFSIYLLVVRHNSTVSNRSSVSILLNPFFFASLCIFVTVTAVGVSVIHLIFRIWLCLISSIGL